jgi:hypothetical protein
MQMDDFMRVSAVITSDTGKGYAKQLVAYTANAILDKTKFLSYMLPQLISAP